MWKCGLGSIWLGKNGWVTRRSLHTIADFFHDEGVEADLVDALVEAVGGVDLPHLLVEQHLLRVRQLRAQDLVVELLWKKMR